jgi:hypothetical protein
MIAIETVKLYRVRCKCGAYAPEARSEDQARRNATHTGWKTIGGDDTCPKCAEKAKAQA